MISLIISIASFIVAGFTFWFNYLKPFRLKINPIGRVKIMNDVYNPDRQTICILLPLSFTNEGAQNGYVENLFIELKDGEKKFLFRPYVEHLTEILGKIPQRRSFRSFFLDGKESKNRKILFKQYNYNNSFNLGERNYSLNLFYKTTKSHKWKKFNNKKLSFRVAKQEVAYINNCHGKKLEDGRSKVCEQDIVFDYLETDFEKFCEK